jgi:uncharacterized protein (DUF302 family)
MKKFLIIISILVSFTHLHANENGLVVKQTEKSVQEVIETSKMVLESKGFTIFAVVDHSAGAKSAGLMLEEEQLIIFGNPKGGTLLMSENANIGLDLPMKILVYSDTLGKTKVVYNDPLYLETRYSILKSSKIITKMQGLFTMLSSKVEAL